MVKSFREAIESILFVGMKPAAPSSSPKGKQRFGPLRGALERFLSGGASDDPLYLTNRTWGQRIRLGVVLAIPCAMVVGLVIFALFGIGHVRKPVPQEVTPAQRAAALLPSDLDRSFSVVNVHPDLDVVEVKVEHNGSPRVVGTVRNRTGKPLARAEVSFDLADAAGSRVGAVTVEVENVPPLGTAAFNVPISQESAVVGIVRDVRAK